MSATNPESAKSSGGGSPAPAAKPANVGVEFTQTGAGVPDGGKKGKVNTRDGSLDNRLLLPCANPECKKGGFLLRHEVDKAVKSGKDRLEIDVACAGYTGPLRSDRGPAPGCGNRLAAKVTISYAKPAAAKPGGGAGAG